MYVTLRVVYSNIMNTDTEPPISSHIAYVQFSAAVFGVNYYINPSKIHFAPCAALFESIYK